MTTKPPIPSADELLAVVQEFVNQPCEVKRTLRAAIYARKSRIEEDAVHYSLEIQPDQAEQYAKSQGWDITKVYSDANRSGRNSRRPDFQRLVQVIRSHSVDVMVVHRLDRLYRNLEAQIRFMRFAHRHKVRLVSVTEQLDTESPWGRLVIYVLGGLAEMQIWQTSERTRESKLARMRKGLPNGMLPLGYCRGLCSACNDPNGRDYCPLYGLSDIGDGRIATPHPVDRQAIQLIFDLYEQGYSFKEIAAYLTQHSFEIPDLNWQGKFKTRNFSPTAGNQHEFTRDGVRIILRNPFYAGLVARYPSMPLDMEDDLENPRRPYAGRTPAKRRTPLELQSGKHQALLSLSQWSRIQRQRQSKGRTPTSHTSPARTYPLSGVARCWECHQAGQGIVNLRGSGGANGAMYYRCAHLHDQYIQRRRNKNQPNVHLPAEPTNAPQQDLLNRHGVLRNDRLMEQVDTLMAGIVLPAAWTERVAAYLLNRDGMVAYTNEMYNLNQQRQRLLELYRDGQISLDEFHTFNQGVQKRAQSIQPGQHGLVERVQARLKDFSLLWVSLPDEKKCLLLGILFSGLYFDGQGKLCAAIPHSPFEQLFDQNLLPS